MIAMRAFLATIAALAVGGGSIAATPSANPLRKIRHIVIIMQENRSFDHYFGTFPGADGIPMNGGRPAVCIPVPNQPTCVAPFHDPNDLNRGGPHNVAAARADIDGGRMDGFLHQQGTRRRCATPADPACAQPAAAESDVMGYHDERELPNYWRYARDYVLQDHLFEAIASWSLPSHLYLVSEWSARCAVLRDPNSCVNEPENPDFPRDFRPKAVQRHGPGRPDYAWTDLTYLLHRKGVSWGYYVMSGLQPDCARDEEFCAGVPQNAKTLGIWNVLLGFDTVKQDGELGNVRDLREFYTAARNGTLPNVVWIAPALKYSEHPPGLISDGQAYVTGLVNAIMQGPAWDSTAIFISWDDWGGFYDHVAPPVVDGNGYGIRVPGLVIGAYARKGLIDHQTLSHDAYVKFIEDVFLGGERIDPRTDGRPDPRPDVRENEPILGDLRDDFDFTQPPRRPEILSGGKVWNGQGIQ